MSRGKNRLFKISIGKTEMFLEKLNQLDLTVAFDQLTPRKREVLKKMLAGQSDQAIAKSLHITEATVRKHVQQLCEKFELRNAPGEHYSLRNQLIDLFSEYHPNLVNPELLSKYRSLSLPAMADSEGQQKPVSLNVDFYIKRIPYEDQLLEAIVKPGALIRIKAPQQMGKTSLIEGVLAEIRKEGYQAVTLSFELADSTVYRDLGKFSRWFCARVGQHLGLSNKLNEYWDDIFGCNSNTTDYFQEYLLPEIKSNIVLVIDKVDRVFEHPVIADDFCRLLRGWYDIARRGDRSSAIWKKLRLVIVHSTEIYSSLDINHSPLANVGLEIELPEFSTEQVQELVKRYGLDGNPREVEQLMAMVGGHPYLLRKGLAYIKDHDITLAQLLELAPTEAGPFSDHLRRHLGNLKQSRELVTALEKVVQANSWVTIPSEQAFKLYSMGLVKLQGNSVMPRCDLYHKYFCDRLCQRIEPEC
ncbi:MAG: hypothetical protein F6K65_24050 [Moorea sp. SIO3C2]|nr:hypothetical protein [Moorena sp. SIO3C2]